MEIGREIQRPLGVVLVEQGLVTHEDVDRALVEQIETNQPLGEILLRRSLIARPMLAKALAAQGGRSLDEEGGFGTGLMAKLEHLHLVRRGLPTDDETTDQLEPVIENRCADLPLYEVPIDPQVELLRQREQELDRRERELVKEAARLARREHKLKRAAAHPTPTPPAA